MKKIRVLFVCLGNICRSPSAEGIFRHRVKEAGLDARIEVDSAGTSDWHIGRAPDPRSIETALHRGYDISTLKARQVCPEDFQAFDFILAMDKENLANLTRVFQPQQSTDVPGGHVGLMLDYGKVFSVTEVPDPYYGDSSAFNHVVDLLDDACLGLLKVIQERL